MEFLAIITVLIALQIWGYGAIPQQDDWLATMHQRVSSIGNLRLRLALLILLPVSVVLILQVVLEGVLWGLPLLLFYVAVLLYSLGRGDFRSHIALYTDAWHRGDLQAATEQARELEGFDHSATPTNASELHAQVRKAVFYQGFERWFAVVFWFVLLGPAAALAYRLFRLLGSRPETTTEEQVLLDQGVQFLEWLPARLLAFTFAVVGDFDRGISAVSPHLTESTPAADLLGDSGHAALAETISADCTADKFAGQAEAELSCAQKLISRSVVCWVAVLAGLQLF
ncbi:AmpE protein [Litorivivens lipolytica]|uniref:AmpE protein n=1 Tax=Litorivivens lipolytica TaxID=1524264 RepID=A0A7W4Z697_9GAMM|nr:regulatory signaling modulator protein AmpE [Litorivivens lipolytica]MBB3048033.1 AmpE protein [Litorivivens lipolytica]